MHTIWVVVFEVIGQFTPSMTTVIVVPKLVPVIVKTVPPVLGPKYGFNPVIVEVLVWEYVTAFERVISVGPFITISHCLSFAGSTTIVEYMIPSIWISEIWHFDTLLWLNLTYWY